MGIVGMRQLILSMGLVWMGVRIRAHKATTPSKRFLFYTKHVLKIVVCAVLMLLCYLHISPLQFKNKSCNGIAKQAFILGANSLVANSLFLSPGPGNLEI
jgi:hypothetical protein